MTAPQPTRDEFLHWRSPVRGTRNPERMNNPFWERCVRGGESAYQINQEFDGPSSFGNDPCWCFDRMGQARVDLPDGRAVDIAGEHEDYYDPDFYIYNDVVIRDGDRTTIYGYPEEVFPPTDFHSATLVGSEILLIGNLGDPQDRRPGETQALRLSTTDWSVSRLPTTGAGPGWIHKHAAAYSAEEHAITLSGGLVDGERLLENFDDYRLDLKTLRWTRLTDRRWGRWILEREDGERHRLWEIRSACWEREFQLDRPDLAATVLADLPEEVAAALAERRTPEISDERMRRVKTLYQSPFSEELAQEAVEEDEEGELSGIGRYRLTIDGTTVRFHEDMSDVTVTVEGRLPAGRVDAVLTNLRDRLSAVEGVPYRIVPIDA